MSENLIIALNRKNDELTDKAIAYDLDQAGIERRTADAVELVDLRARVAVLQDACKSAIWDLRMHDYNDECGYLDSTESDLVKCLPGVCLDCYNGLERHPSGAYLTCGKCEGSGRIDQSGEGKP